MNPDWVSKVIDIKGAFLQGRFKIGEELYIEIPEGFDQYYKGDVVIWLNIRIYGTKQAAACFYKALVDKVKDREYELSTADPCIYYTWKDGRLSAILSWVNDIVALGNQDDVDQIERDLADEFVCRSEAELKEYVGSKIDII